MVDWKVTATTIYCDVVDGNVTVMVYKVRSTKCAGYARYGQEFSNFEVKALKKEGRYDRELRCEGPECLRVLATRDWVYDK
jgi:hypothetical protein